MRPFLSLAHAVRGTMRRALVLSVLLVLAGCSAPLGGDSASPTTETGDGATPSGTTTDPATTTTAGTPGDGADGSDAEPLVTVEGADLDANATDLFLRTRDLLNADTEAPRVVVTRSPDVPFPDREVRTFRALFLPSLDPDAPRRPGADTDWPGAAPAFYYQTTHTVYVNPRFVDNPAVEIEEILIEEFAHAVQFRNETFSAYYDARVDGIRFRSTLTTDDRLTTIAVREGVGDVYVTSRVQVESFDFPADRTIARFLATQYARAGVAYRLAYGPYLFGHEYANRTVDSAVGTFAVYADPPTTGEQVLHDTDEPPTNLTVDVRGDLTRARSDTYGELFLRPALSAGLDRDEAARAADGWGDDVLLNLTYDGETGPESGFVWVLDWDDPEEATEFARLFDSYLEERGRAADDGRYALENREWELRVVDEDTVAVVIGQPSFHAAVTVEDAGNETVAVDA